MNALYVTVSIPLLLLFAGFNHAHGLTTFGKSQPSNSNQQPQQLPARPCTDNKVCEGIIGASCVQDPKDHARKSCLCGDNQPPVNGGCSAAYSGPNHLCKANKDCVEGAKCIDVEKNGSQITEKLCKCTEGLVEHNNMCSGGTPTSVLSGLIILMALTRTLLY
ncbi:PREDICTED: uncharacterized protein LOC108566763 [Nicrophorus vespilloides]|uniref:Uncharacterized protein LOC108566763 n=1 Tax=Nicrophorus vespilloides TaxID=110193 RepID=A0ABM1N635_NICVS|nr:PREDICTED: uncharacterized protein LOC108566763 [Nicrophorus vespilloides]